MKKCFACLNVGMLAALAAGMVNYMQRGGLNNKALAAGCFAALGAVNLVYALLVRPRRLLFPGLMCAGLLLAMSGDILLGRSFILGAGLFALGHVMYAAAMCAVVRPCRRDLAVSAVVFAAAAGVVLFLPGLDFGGALMQGVCLVYALIISCMVGKALSDAVWRPTLLTLLMAAGSVLFFFSDLMLVLYMFGDAPWIVDRLCLLTYFPAQGLLALSSFVYTRAGTV